MLPLGCTSYWRWCALTRVSTCAAVNTCTKHKKQCLKGNCLYGLLKKDPMLRRKTRGRGGTITASYTRQHYCYTRWHYILQGYTRWHYSVSLHEVALLPLHEVASIATQGGTTTPTRGGTTASRGKSTQARQDSVILPRSSRKRGKSSSATSTNRGTKGPRRQPTISNDLGCQFAVDSSRFSSSHRGALDLFEHATTTSAYEDDIPDYQSKHHLGK